MKKIFFGLFLVVINHSFSQQFEITGVLQDINNEPIESATVYVESIQDSTMISYSISDKNGVFSIEGRTKKEEANFFVSYTGMKTFSQKVNLTKNKIDLKKIILLENAEELNAVLVVADRAPITIKKDTLQFNAASFKTGADANVEDLLKKLPGMVVDKNGDITVNGKPVNKILVNGKEFFGSDFKIATKNLPKEIIDKIQVVDTKTKSEAFTGEDGDKENKTINITIKEDKNKGMFGRATVGYGTDDRYSVSGILNYFNDKERLSILGGTNNVNTSGFNSDEVKDIGGGSNNWVRRNGVWQPSNQLFSNYSEGITETTSAGIHYANEWKEKYDITTDYLFNKSDSKTNSISSRETFLDGSSYYTDSNEGVQNFNDSHNVYFEYEVKPDTLTRISFKPNVKKSSGESFSFNDGNNLDGTNSLISTSSANTKSEYKNDNINLDFRVSRKFKEKGEFFQLSTDLGFVKSDTEDIFDSGITYYDGGITPNQNTNQLKISESKSSNLGLRLNYTRLIKGNWFYVLRMNSNFDYEKNMRNTFDFDNTSQTYNVVNTGLTHKFKTRTSRYTPKAGIKYTKNKMNVRLTVGYDFINIHNKNVLTNDKLSNDFTAFNVRASLWSRFGKGNSYWFSLDTRSDTPRVEQLQPITDNSNPLNTITGNPNLKATNRTNFRGSYRIYDVKTKSGYNFYGNFSLTDNQIVSTTLTNQTTFIRETSYVNVDGIINYFGRFKYNKKHKIDENSISWEVGANLNGGKNKAFSNGLSYISDRLSYGFSGSVTYNFKELIEVAPHYEFNTNETKYSTDLGRDTKFNSSNFGVTLETYWPKWVEFSNDFSLAYNPNVADGFTKNTYMWNASLGVKMIKDKGILKLKVFDLLDQNTSVYRSVNQDYVEDVENLVLKQYFMLSFTYKINKFKGGNEKEKGRRSH